ncbi:hypothetical protein F4802DRAFT_596761 [Xylaria palmicola]|nr:hypothetical protein F4802DRAFT_596761 [Xylaria palmicola]
MEGCTEEQIKFILDRTVRMMSQGETNNLYENTAEAFSMLYGIEVGADQVQYVTEMYRNDPLYGNPGAGIVTSGPEDSATIPSFNDTFFLSSNTMSGDPNAQDYGGGLSSNPVINSQGGQPNLQQQGATAQVSLEANVFSEHQHQVYQQMPEYSSYAGQFSFLDHPQHASAPNQPAQIQLPDDYSFPALDWAWYDNMMAANTSSQAMIDLGHQPFASSSSSAQQQGGTSLLGNQLYGYPMAAAGPISQPIGGLPALGNILSETAVDPRVQMPNASAVAPASSAPKRKEPSDPFDDDDDDDDDLGPGYPGVIPPIYVPDLSAGGPMVPSHYQKVDLQLRRAMNKLRKMRKVAAAMNEAYGPGARPRPFAPATGPALTSVSNNTQNGTRPTSVHVSGPTSTSVLHNTHGHTRPSSVHVSSTSMLNTPQDFTPLSISTSGLGGSFNGRRNRYPSVPLQGNQAGMPNGYPPALPQGNQAGMLDGYPPVPLQGNPAGTGYGNQRGLVYRNLPAPPPPPQNTHRNVEPRPQNPSGEREVAGVSNNSIGMLLNPDAPDAAAPDAAAPNAAAPNAAAGAGADGH